MIEFAFERATEPEGAVALHHRLPGAKYLGGGTNLVDLMRENVERPATLIDVSRVSAEICELPNGALWIGAGAKNTAVAAHRLVRERYPVLSAAILNGASGQIRNMATVGGNLLQRTRCRYFYDRTARCNKREPGVGCDALDGFHRMHAILGTSPHCIAAHPSDMCVALAVLDVAVHVTGSKGNRVVPFLGLHRLPGETPEIETNLEPGELITALEIAPLPLARRSCYRKVRDRASYAFALVSVAAALDRAENGAIREARIGLGGVAHKPWRASAAEAVLRGAAATAQNFEAAAEAELSGASGREHNHFKISLVKRVLVEALKQLAAEDAQ